MFQFSDNFDEEAEDFLSIPLDEKNSSNQNEHLSRVDSPAKNDPTFDDFDDEMVLSIVENVDSALNGTVQNAALDDSSLSSRRRTPSKEPNTSATAKKKCVQERLESFVCRKPALSSHSTSKHKLVSITNESPSKSLKLEYERKFPGPAGLILKKSRDSLSGEELNSSGFKQQLNVSITDDTLTTNSNWLKLYEEVNAKSCEQSKIMNEFTVVALKRNLKQLSRKIPLFAAVISDVDSTVSDPSVGLKDLTGEIRGMLQRDLWEQYSHLLVVGSALLLRRVSVLKLGNTKGFYVNITTNNVDTIYSYQSGNESVRITRVTTSATLDSLYEKSETATRAFNHSMISTNEEDSGRKKSSFPSVSSINNELEGIDVDSLLEDF